jgi:hypothetical protein
MLCSYTALPSSAGNKSVADFIDIMTYIEGALPLLGMRAMTKMAVVEEIPREQSHLMSIITKI